MGEDERVRMSGGKEGRGSIDGDEVGESWRLS